MHEKLNQLERNNVWYSVSKPGNCNVIGMKYIFKNKTDDQGTITMNKARLVSHG